MNEIILKVEGMACEGCENRIQNAIKNMQGIENVVANYKEGTVKITANEINLEKITEKIENIGFKVR